MSFTLPENLPSIRNAQLPGMYIAAKEALAACNRLDECKDWADKSAALASYAKQADDDELEKHALRVRARAIRRCGELLQAMEKSKGGRPPKETYRDAPIGKSEAARQAGMSQDQKNTALRVASIPEEEFTEAVESHSPPTITDLAEKGTVKKYLSPAEIIGDRDPKDFQAALHAVGDLRQFVTVTMKHDPAAIVRGSDARDRAHMRDLIQQIILWINALTHCIGETEDADTNETRTT